MARELQDILNSAEVTGQKMATSYAPSNSNDVEIHGHNHDSDYDAAGSSNTVQGNLDAHTGNAGIHFTQSAISITESQISDIGNYVESAQENNSGTLLDNIVQVTQAEYDALTPNSTTVYLIVG